MLGGQFVLSTASLRTSQKSTVFTVFGVYHQQKNKSPSIPLWITVDVFLIYGGYILIFPGFSCLKKRLWKLTSGRLKAHRSKILNISLMLYTLFITVKWAVLNQSLFIKIFCSSHLTCFIHTISNNTYFKFRILKIVIDQVIKTCIKSYFVRLHFLLVKITQ